MAVSEANEGNLAAAAEREKLEIEREKLKIEREKLGVERERQKIEQTKEWWSRITGMVALIVPLMAALMTLWYTASSFRKQMAQQAEQQVASAKLAFEMKAAEIAFAGRTPEAVNNRAAALKVMFGQRLPPTFLEVFDPKKFGGGKETPETKQTFLELILKYPDQKDRITQLWDALFSDEWVARAKSVLNDNAPRNTPNP